MAVTGTGTITTACDSCYVMLRGAESGQAAACALAAGEPGGEDHPAAGQGGGRDAVLGAGGAERGEDDRADHPVVCGDQQGIPGAAYESGARA
jgi:hypothetical protein